MSAPTLPEYDPTDITESAVINGLVRTWNHRATVRKREPELDDLFDLTLADYPEALIPFSGHERFLALDADVQNRIRAWAWIAYNKTVMDIEQFVVNPGFGLLVRDGFGIGIGDTHRIATLQAMVDEEYHTLMHLNASVLTRKHRGWQLSETQLPHCRTVREHGDAVARADDPRHAAILRLAYTTVAETSISAYLGLMTEDKSVQPVNRSTVALHRRDELCHSSIAGELTKIVYDSLDDGDRARLLAALATGLEAFTGSDYTTWAAILDAEHIEGAEQMLRDIEDDAGDARVVQDCSAIQRLCDELGVDLPHANAEPHQV